MAVLAVSGRLSFWVAENQFFMIPIESVIRDQQADYYGVLRRGDEAGDSTPFIEFLLNAILASCR